MLKTAKEMLRVIRCTSVLLPVLAIRQFARNSSLAARTSIGKTKRGKTPLHLSIFHELHSISQMLIDNGAKTSVGDYSGRSPFGYNPNPAVYTAIIFPLSVLLESHCDIWFYLIQSTTFDDVKPRLLYYIQTYPQLIINVKDASGRKAVDVATEDNLQETSQFCVFY